MDLCLMKKIILLSDTHHTLDERFFPHFKKADEIYKLQLEKILLNHIWDNRIIIRKNGHLCKLVHRTALRMLKIYDHMGILPPKILLKTATM